MAEPSPDKIVIGAIGPLITTVIGAAWIDGRHRLSVEEGGVAAHRA